LKHEIILAKNLLRKES